MIPLVNHDTRLALEHSHTSLLLYYPFDRYWALFAHVIYLTLFTIDRCVSYNSEIFASAQDTSTNEPVSLVLNSGTGRIV